jgi:ADP-ribose pyrophosphatase YjhB (NUDIX family)
MSKPKEETINGKITHFSVGAIIKNDKGEYLLIDRLKPPFGFACPAGHIDEGELSHKSVIREVEEETGLKIDSLKYLNKYDYRCYDDIPMETCSRGVSVHNWALYEVTVTSYDDIILKKDEVKSIGWYSPEQIQGLQLETVWNHFFKKLGIIK